MAKCVALLSIVCTSITCVGATLAHTDWSASQVGVDAPPRVRYGMGHGNAIRNYRAFLHFAYNDAYDDAYDDALLSWVSLGAGWRRTSRHRSGGLRDVHVRLTWMPRD